MRFTWDRNKSARNVRERGLDFADAPQLWGSPMLVWEDRRRDYGEARYAALGVIGERVFAVAFATPDPDLVRIIMFRKANRREQRRYATEIDA